MSLDRVRIVPPYQQRGDIAFGLLLGLVFGAAAGLLVTLALNRSRLWFAPAEFFLAGVVLLAAPLCVGVAIPYFTDAERPLKSVFVPFSIAWTAAFFTQWHLWSPALTGNVAAAPIVGTLVTLPAALGALLLMLLALIWRRFAHRAIVQPVPQDGDRCWRCAYQLGSARIERCPECATPRDATRFHWGWLYRAIAWTQARAWKLLLAFLTLATVAIAFIIWDRGFPVGRLMASIARQPNFRLLGSAVDDEAFGFNARGVTVPVQFGTLYAHSVAVIVHYCPHRFDDGPVLQLRTATMMFMMTGESVMVPTNPVVCCDFDHELAERVLDHKIPDALIEEMIARAEAQAVNPTAPGSSSSQRPIMIDPRPSLEPLRAAPDAK